MRTRVLVHNGRPYFAAQEILEVAARLQEAGVPIREIGDVKGVGYLEGAIRDGFEAALAL